MLNPDGLTGLHSDPSTEVAPAKPTYTRPSTAATQRVGLIAPHHDPSDGVTNRRSARRRSGRSTRRVLGMAADRGEESYSPRSPAVTLPDYQGVGICNAVSDVIACMWRGLTYCLTRTTTHPAMIVRVKRLSDWRTHRAPSPPRTEGGMKHATTRLYGVVHLRGPAIPRDDCPPAQKLVADARGVEIDPTDRSVTVWPLRGELLNMGNIAASLKQREQGEFAFLIVDAFYRTLCAKMDENSNADMAGMYNTVDRIAEKTGAAVALVHHSSKGNQSEKSVTDVGSGAGSISRAADTHLILRRHQEEGVYVVDAALRSWPPTSPFCIRWHYPLWELAPDLDPAELWKPRKAVKKDETPFEAWDVQRFAALCPAEPTPPVRPSPAGDGRRHIGAKERRTCSPPPSMPGCFCESKAAGKYGAKCVSDTRTPHTPLWEHAMLHKGTADSRACVRRGPGAERRDIRSIRCKRVHQNDRKDRQGSGTFGFGRGFWHGVLCGGAGHGTGWDGSIRGGAAHHRRLRACRGVSRRGCRGRRRPRRRVSGMDGARGGSSGQGRVPGLPGRHP